jgi:hypothetical protein
MIELITKIIAGNYESVPRTLFLLSEDCKILLRLFAIAACLETGGSLPSASSFGIS